MKGKHMRTLSRLCNCIKSRNLILKEQFTSCSPVLLCNVSSPCVTLWRFDYWNWFIVCQSFWLWEKATERDLRKIKSFSVVKCRK